MILLVVAAIILIFGISIIVYLKFYGEQIRKFKIKARYKPSNTWVGINFGFFSSRKTLILIPSLISSTILFLLFCRYYCESFYMTAIAFVGFIFLSKWIIASTSGKKKDDLLNELPEFIGDIKHNYHACRMIEESVYEAYTKGRSGIMLQGKKLYEILSNRSGDIFLHEYYEKCPDRYLKILAGFSYLIKEFGDKKVNGISLYIKNLNYITDEINLEIIKRKQLSHWLKGLTIISAFPLVFPPMLENWMSSSFPPAKEFFSSSTAFIIKILIILLVLLCCLILHQLKENEVKLIKGKKQNGQIDYKILKMPFIKVFIKILSPRKNTFRYKNVDYLLKDAASPLTVECVYLRKTICAIAVFLLSIALMRTAHNIDADAILNNASYKSQESKFSAMLGKIDKDEERQQKKINAFDRLVISEIRNFSKKFDKGALLNLINRQLKEKGCETEELATTVERIFNKFNDSEKEKISITEILAAIMFAFIFSSLPIWILAFKKSLRKAEMQDEVFRFHMIIILLMHHENADVQVILEWMCRFGNVFKASINRCLNNFQHPDKALEILKGETKFKPFVNIVENLQMANEKISIVSAFDALELEREFYRENRKEANKQAVEKKIALGRMIGFVPFYAVIFLYMVLPLMFTSFMSLRSIMSQLGSL